MLTREYVATEHGQLHVRIWSGVVDSDRPPVICLPPAPFSGAAYETLAPHLCDDVPLIANDYPDYGVSDTCKGKPSIGTYARAALAAAGEFSAHMPPTLLGFHTGCLVGVEAAVLAPTRVGRLVLVDVPYFDADRRESIVEELNTNAQLGEELSILEQDWSAYVTGRLDNVLLKHAFQLFIDQPVDRRNRHHRVGAGTTGTRHRIGRQAPFALKGRKERRFVGPSSQTVTAGAVRIPH